jgi:hypothetical protein
VTKACWTDFCIVLKTPADTAAMMMAPAHANKNAFIVSSSSSILQIISTNLQGNSIVEALQLCRLIRFDPRG